MKRPVFKIAATTLAVLMVGGLGMWVSSYWVMSSVFWRYHEQRQAVGDVNGVYGTGGGRTDWEAVSATVDRGDVALLRVRTDNDSADARGIPRVIANSQKTQLSWPRFSGGTIWNRLGFGITNSRGFRTSGPTPPTVFNQEIVTVHVPAWFVVLLTGVLPGICLMQWMRRRRYGPGMCQVCGYDLQATPERCPECGTGVSELGRAVGQARLR